MYIHWEGFESEKQQLTFGVLEKKELAEGGIEKKIASQEK